MGLSRAECFRVVVVNLLSSCTASHPEWTPSGKIEKDDTSETGCLVTLIRIQVKTGIAMSVVGMMRLVMETLER